MCHMRKGFPSSTPSRWNADASELISSWSSKFSKEKLMLTRVNSSSVHPEPVYEGTPTDYCNGQAVIDAGAVASRVGPASPRENHGDASWVVSTSRSPVPAPLQLLALQLKPNLPGLRASQHPLFNPPPGFYSG